MAPIGQAGLVEIARRIARKMERSTETVRMTLKTYDLEHPDRAIFPPSTGPARRGRPRPRSTGSTTTAGASRPRTSPRSSTGPGRASTGSSTRCGPSGSRRRSWSSCRIPASTTRPPATRSSAPMPEPLDGKPPRKTKAPKGLPPYLASLYEVPLLTREQEAHLFRKMNYLRFLASQAPRLDRAGQGPDRPTSTRSSGSRTRPWPSRTRSSAPTSAWSSRSPSGTSAPPTTSSTWSPTAT